MPIPSFGLRGGYEHEGPPVVAKAGERPPAPAPLPPLDPRPTAAQGWLPVILHPRHWPRWLPRMALSPLCWLIGHRGRQVYLHGCVSIECSRCRMRLIVVQGKKDATPSG